MKHIYDAYLINCHYINMDLDEVVAEFEEYTKQIVPRKAVEDFRFCGLHHVDFLLSDFLNHYEILNLPQFILHNERLHNT